MAFFAIRGLSSLGDIAKAAAIARQAIGKTPGVGLELDDFELAKLKWLAKGGRDFREVTPKMLNRMGEAFSRALARVIARKADPTAPWIAAAQTYVDIVSERLATGGGDVKSHMKPLKPETIERKGHARIGIDSGALLRAVATAKVRLTR